MLGSDIHIYIYIWGECFSPWGGGYQKNIGVPIQEKHPGFGEACMFKLLQINPPPTDLPAAIAPGGFCGGAG